MPFTPVTTPQKPIKYALQGPTGSGKTHWALAIMDVLRGDKPMALLDTESERGKLFARKYTYDYMQLSDFDPNRYVLALAEACGVNLHWPLPQLQLASDTIPDLIMVAKGTPYGGLVMDSITHAWDNTNGLLDQVAKAGGQFQDAWRKIGTPLQNRFMQSIIKAPIHLGCTMRVKMDYVLEETVNKNGYKTTSPKRIGLQPIQRDNTAYEFDFIFDIDMDHILTVSKCPPIDGLIGMKFQPGKTHDLTDIITQWMGAGTIEIRPISVPSSTFAPAQSTEMGVAEAVSAEAARGAGYVALCQKLVENGHYPARANVTATMKLLHLSYALAQHDEILAALIAHATTVDAAIKEGADAVETIGPAEGIEHPVAEGAPKLP
jgi:hypothetical protein